MSYDPIQDHYSRVMFDLLWLICKALILCARALL